MELHHGDIRVFSKGEGTGCTFTVDLPMTRKMEPIVLASHIRRRSTRERLVGLLGIQTFHRRPTSSPAFPPAPQDANNQAALHSLPPTNPRLISPLIIDDPAPFSMHCNGAQIDPNLPNQERVRSGGSVVSIGLQSLRDLAEHDRTVTSAARQAKATALLHKESTDRRSSPTRNPERRVASGGGLNLSPLLLRGKHTCDDVAVAVGSDHAADPPSQQLRPAATTVVTSSPSPAPLSSRVTAPSSSAAPSRKSQILFQNEQLPPQGPVYHILVVDDSTMTRKMLMKTLRNGGLTHPLNTLDTSSHLSNTLNPHLD